MSEEKESAKIVFNGVDESAIEIGSSLQQCCEEQGVPFACTEGVCGTCLIEVTSGMESLSEKTQEERDFLGDYPSNERLACQCKIAASGLINIRY